MKLRHTFSLLFVLLFTSAAAEADQPTERSAKQIVQDSVEHWRDDSSHLKARMKVHRPDWERSSELESWTKDMTLSLVRFTKPAKDSGNATLTKDEEIWTFSPKTNRVIKIPASMKTQSWMGSDFSYQDLSRDDEIINQYTHRLLSSTPSGAHTIFAIESVPLEEAPIVWGKEILRIRDDNIVLEHEFYDQDGVLVKKLITTSIGSLGGKEFPLIMRMQSAETAEEWTEIEHVEAEFDIGLRDSIFTLSNLRNPR